MSQPTDTAPETVSHQALDQLIDHIGAELRALAAGYDQQGRDPRTWPHMAVHMQRSGPLLAELGEQLAASLAAYAEAHPTIEVPDDGVPVLVLSTGEHTEYWNLAGELPETASTEDDALAAYAEALNTTYGRPELDVRAVALPEDGAVMVLQYVAERGPDAVCRVFIGGVDHNDSDRILQALDTNGIAPGSPRFWPPIAPDLTFLSPPGPDLYDAYGRKVAMRPSQV